MQRPPWWTWMSAGAAPVVLIGGWTLAAAAQPAGYRPLRDTISALAAQGATDRWIMTSALLGLGACHVATAAGLSPVRRPGRALHALGGAATILVAAFPQPVRGSSPAHTAAATVAFVALGAWPAFAGRRAAPALLLRPAAGLAAAAALLGLVAWFGGDLHGGLRGLSERCAAGAEALWPLAVVAASRRSPGLS